MIIVSQWSESLQDVRTSLHICHPYPVLSLVERGSVRRSSICPRPNVSKTKNRFFFTEMHDLCACVYGTQAISMERRTKNALPRMRVWPTECNTVRSPRSHRAHVYVHICTYALGSLLVWGCYTYWRWWSGLLHYMHCAFASLVMDSLQQRICSRIPGFRDEWFGFKPSKQWIHILFVNRIHQRFILWSVRTTQQDLTVFLVDK